MQLFFFFFDSFIFEFLIGRKLSFPLFSGTSNHLFLLLHEGLSVLSSTPKERFRAESGVWR